MWTCLAFIYMTVFEKDKYDAFSFLKPILLISAGWVVLGYVKHLNDTIQSILLAEIDNI